VLKNAPFMAIAGLWRGTENGPRVQTQSSA
jgi:hypothetical protein